MESKNQNNLTDQNNLNNQNDLSNQIIQNTPITPSSQSIHPPQPVPITFLPQHGHYSHLRV